MEGSLSKNGDDIPPHAQPRLNGRQCSIPFPFQGVSMRGNVAAIVLVLVGTFFLLSNLGLIDISLTQLIKTWWPIILIAVGVSLFFTPDKQKKD
jgi:hypothetical protein